MGDVNAQLGTVAALNHPNLGPVNYRVDPVSDDPDTQVAQVIGMMSTLASEDAHSPAILNELANIRRKSYLAGSGPRSDVDNIYSHVKGRMTFMHDEATALPLQHLYADPIVECLIRPADLAVARTAQGDCDDYSMYTASLLTAAQIPCAFVTVSEPEQPDIFSHVYVAAYPGGKRVPLDVSHGPGPGWETDRAVRLKEWPVSGGKGGLIVAGVLLFGVMFFARRKD